MDDNFTVINHYLMVRMPKEVDQYFADLVRERADRVIMSEQVWHIIFDFEDTGFMDSSGIGVILGRYKKIKNFGGKIYIIHADRRMQRILTMSGIHKVAEIMN